ncbi:MAG: glycoside hydrolase family 127 protein [Candidatus Aminicenantes bacterium]|nr:glycoside hydrolase family 127 protein [Candidatus Aminicenantes bacterium]
MRVPRRSVSSVILVVCVVLSLAAAGGPQDKAALTDTMFAAASVKPAVPVEAYPFSLKNVQLLDGPFKTAMERDLGYMLSLDNDRLLHMFRVTAGLPSTAEAYGGWEKADVELRGHTIGHFLSASALMFASTGDARVKAKADAVVAALAECQKAFGPSGYLSAFPETFFDRVESVRSVWAPYYTLHKIMAGLVDMFEYCDSRQALEVVEGMARWVKSRTDKSDRAHMERVLNFTEQGGMNEVLANLYAITGKADYLATARRFDERKYTEPLSHSVDKMKGEHVNSFIPNIIGAAREYEMTGEPVLRAIATFFWNEVTGARSFVTGGTSDNEAWESDPYQLYEELGRNSHESCCTYNMLKLTRHLFSWEAAAKYADYYERALWNGILPTQNPSDAMMMYYVPMLPGMFKTFMKPYDSFWCCTGTGMENHAKYGDSIYFQDGGGLFVNLFIASELDWKEKGVKVRQETRFPEEPKTTLIIGAAKPVALALRIRVPGWIAGVCSVKINGKRHEASASPSSYLTIARTWKNGDRIEVDLPMKLRLERLPDRPDVAAILYGPIVLAGALGGAEGLSEDKVYGKYGPEGDPVAVPKFDVKDNVPLEAWIKPVAGKPLTFRTEGAGKPNDVTLVPFYKLFGERYAIYWQLAEPPRRAR